MRSLILILSVVLWIPFPAHAQNRPYVGVAFHVSTQDSHRRGTAPSLPTTGAGGTAIGMVLEGGMLITDRLALGAELSVPQRFTALQQTNHLRVFQHESRHRDLALSAVMRGRLGSNRSVGLWVIGGGGVVHESTRQRRRDQATPIPTSPPVFGPYSSEYSFTRWTPAAVAGADVEVAVTRGLVMAPEFRVHLIRRRAADGSMSWLLGLEEIVFRSGVALRFVF